MRTIFTHNDLDGIGCGLLFKIAFGEKEKVHYCSYGDINKKVENFLEKEHNEKVDLYITDISVNNQVAEKVEEFFKKGNNVFLIDHHQTAKHLNQYDWGTVQEYYEDGKKTAGTSLLYEQLLKKGELEQNDFLDSFVELVRMYDTWEWDEKNELAPKRLNDLFYILGFTRFEKEMLEREKGKKQFTFSETEELILELEEKKIERAINAKNNQMKELWLDELKFGVVHSENYHSELGNQLSKLNEHLDFIALVNAGVDKVSLRTIHDVDVSKVAQRFGGGGHPKASGCPLNQEAFELFVVEAYKTKPSLRDYLKNQYNTKENEFLSLYKTDEEIYVTISKKGENRWDIVKDGITEQTLSNFKKAENYAKRKYSLYLVSDNEYIAYLVENFEFNEHKLRSNFAQEIKKAKEIMI